MLTLVLPFPPSVNTYWRRHGHVYYVASAGLKFRRRVGEIAAVIPGIRYYLDRRVVVDVRLYKGDRRDYDLDNFAKAILDALVHAGMLRDDRQVDMLVVHRGETVAGGACIVEVMETSHEVRRWPEAYPLPDWCVDKRLAKARKKKGT